MKSKMSEGIMQQKSPSEGQIPESGATNEERNVVGLNRIDAEGNSSKKKDTISRWQKDHGITLEVLEQLFDKSRDDAAKTLNVSTSTLKRACRDFGITRWSPHKGKRVNSSLNQKGDVKKHKGSQPCPPLPPEEATTTLQGNSAMTAKVTYENDTIRFSLSSSSTMKILEEEWEKRFKIPLDNFSIKYKDEEDEWISLMCDSDLICCMGVLRSSGKSVIRMKVSPKSLTAPIEYNISSLTENLPSPDLAKQAQPLPNAASPAWPLSNRVGPSQGGKGVSEIHEPPNTTPIGLGTTANTAALMKSKMSERDTSVASHLQRDDDHCVNTEYSNQEELFNIHNLQGGMMVSSPRMKFSLPSGDSLGIFDPVSLWNCAEHSEVQQLENGKEMTWPTWKQPCIQVDTTLGNNQTLGIWPALEPERMGGMVQQSSGTNPQRNDVRSVNVLDLYVDGLLHMPNFPVNMAGGVMVIPPRMNSSLPSDDSPGNFDPDSLLGDEENCDGEVEQPLTPDLDEGR